MMRRFVVPIVWAASVLGASSIFWVLFGACVGCFGCVDTDDPYDPEVEPIAKVLVHWDPLACGPPHRIAIVLEDPLGQPLEGSVPCNRGGMILDATHWDRYRGRIERRTHDDASMMASIAVPDLTVDRTIMPWAPALPPLPRSSEPGGAP